jgi:site-specific recombinase XerC
LHLEGALERSLAGAVPSVAGWRLSGLPKRLERDQVDALLESCDASTVIETRDLAILTVLARLSELHHQGGASASRCEDRVGLAAGRGTPLAESS